MFYKILFIFIVATAFIYAENFSRVNPKPTIKMLENQANATPCASPVMAKDEITDQFKYGCFCGKNYPNVDKNSTVSFTKLNKAERIKRIESFYLIEPYDEVDAICQQHDICYLYRGKRAKRCNDTIYDELHTLAYKFREADDKLHNRQCYNLSSDMASVFRTIFASADDQDTLFEAGMLLLSTSITMANKTFQESIDLMIRHQVRYPKHKCISSDLKQK